MNTRSLSLKTRRGVLVGWEAAAMLLLVSMLATAQPPGNSPPPGQLRLPEQTWRSPDKPVQQVKFVDWVDKFLSANTPAAKAQLEPQGLVLARDRRARDAAGARLRDHVAAGDAADLGVEEPLALETLRM